MNKINKKVIINVILSLIIIAGIIVTVTVGFNKDLNYSNHKEIDIYLGKEFENKEIENIVKEVVGSEKVIVNKVELYEDMVSITIKDISDEKLSELNTKINEKYEIENKIEDLIVTEVASVRIRDLIKPYIIPTIISLIVILIYVLGYIVLYKKMRDKKAIKILLKTLAIIIGVEALYFSIIAITRMPVTSITIPVAIILFALTTVIIMYKLDKNIKSVDAENKAKNN